MDAPFPTALDPIMATRVVVTFPLVVLEIQPVRMFRK